MSREFLAGQLAGAGAILLGTGASNNLDPFFIGLGLILFFASYRIRD